MSYGIEVRNGTHNVRFGVQDRLARLVWQTVVPGKDIVYQYNNMPPVAYQDILFPPEVDMTKSIYTIEWHRMSFGSYGLAFKPEYTFPCYVIAPIANGLRFYDPHYNDAFTSVYADPLTYHVPAGTLSIWEYK